MNAIRNVLTSFYLLQFFAHCCIKFRIIHTILKKKHDLYHFSIPSHLRYDLSYPCFYPNKRGKISFVRQSRQVCNFFHTWLSNSLSHSYFAKALLLRSRITVTRICPGYSISFSIRPAILCANESASKSSTRSGSTSTRISRPACMA
jgi:hypothetical protein